MSEPNGLRQAQVGGVLLGVGLGGFVDGILLHQILQWHHMMSMVHPPTTLDALQRNTLWDGLFHVFTWAAVVVGLLLLWTGARRSVKLPSTRWLLGLILIGWGIFNLTDGIVNHHILQIHHVRDAGPHLVWDLVFLLSGAVLVGLGWLLLRAGAGRPDVAGRRPHAR